MDSGDWTMDTQIVNYELQTTEYRSESIDSSRKPGSWTLGQVCVHHRMVAFTLGRVWSGAVGKSIRGGTFIAAAYCTLHAVPIVC